MGSFRLQYTRLNSIKYIKCNVKTEKLYNFLNIYTLSSLVINLYKT